MPARAIIASTGAYPAGPHDDGTLLIDIDTGLLYYWDAPASQWLDVRRA